MDPRQGLHARLEELMEQYEKTRSNLSGLQQRLQELTGTARSDDGMVTVIVGPRGQVLDLELDPRIYRRPNSKELAKKIVKAITEASEQVTAEVEELVKPYAPAEHVKDQMNFDFDSMLKRVDNMIEGETSAGGR